MEITIETYGDGHREITIDGKRYWVKEKRNFQLSSVGPTMDKNTRTVDKAQT
jgi:hypothetical protein